MEKRISSEGVGNLARHVTHGAGAYCYSRPTRLLYLQASPQRPAPLLSSSLASDTGWKQDGALAFCWKTHFRSF